MSAHPNDGRPKGLQSISDRALVAGRLVYQDGQSHADVARAMGVSLSTVKGLLSAYRAWQEDQKLLAAMRRSG